MSHFRLIKHVIDPQKLLNPVRITKIHSEDINNPTKQLITVPSPLINLAYNSSKYASAIGKNMNKINDIEHKNSENNNPEDQELNMGSVNHSPAQSF